MAEKRKERNKNYWPTVAVTAVWWGLWGALVWWVEPVVVADFPIAGSYLAFMGLMFMAVWFLVSLLLANSRRGALVAVGMVGWGYLLTGRVAGWFNVALWWGALVALEVYLSSRKG